MEERVLQSTLFLCELFVVSGAKLFLCLIHTNPLASLIPVTAD